MKKLDKQFNINSHLNFSAPEDDYISIHIRQVGDFSIKLGSLFGVVMDSGSSKQEELSSEYISEVICNCDMPRLLVDGPYGAPAEVRQLFKSVYLLTQNSKH